MKQDSIELNATWQNVQLSEAGHVRVTCNSEVDLNATVRYVELNATWHYVDII